MMRVLLSTIGSRGDVQPLVALALQLKAIGHEAHLCVPPDFCDWIKSLEILVTPIGPKVRSIGKAGPAVTLPTPEQRRQMMESMVAMQFETITTAAQNCDIIVAATALQIAARSVAEKMGIPYIFVAYSPVVLPSLHHAPPPLPPLPGETPLPATTDNLERWAHDTKRFNDTFGAALNALRVSMDLTPVNDVRRHIFTDRPWLAADPELAPWPDPSDQAVFQTGAWILPDARPLSPELEAFLDAGEPPVYFGFGSTRAPADLSRVMIQTARALGRRAIISQGWADLSLIDNEPDCLVVGDVNLPALFKQVAAAVHHGGAGTTTLAARAGVPQVIISQLYDQHYWAKRVQHLGIGTAPAPGTPTADSLTSALEHALRPDAAIQAQSIATTVRSDGVQVAAQRLMRTVAS
ncbi:MAG: Glycosyltransferase GtfC [Anaerolineae bacterium]|nr:Glycosyltransferase GtfC [Anaerolineae bacterium]